MCTVLIPWRVTPGIGQNKTVGCSASAVGEKNVFCTKIMVSYTSCRSELHGCTDYSGQPANHSPTNSCCLATSQEKGSSDFLSNQSFSVYA